MKLRDKIVMTLALGAFVFVILCPDIPPPNGVKDQSDTSSLLLRPAVVLFVAASPTLSATASRGRTLTGDAIVALTCARLC